MNPPPPIITFLFYYPDARCCHALESFKELHGDRFRVFKARGLSDNASYRRLIEEVAEPFFPKK